MGYKKLLCITDNIRAEKGLKKIGYKEDNWMNIKYIFWTGGYDSTYLICKSNYIGSISVFTAAIQNNVKRIVFCSSIARYGEVQIPYTEHGQTNPVDPYGISKLAAEKILINLCILMV